MNSLLRSLTCLGLLIIPAAASNAAVRPMTEAEMRATTGGYQETGRCHAIAPTCASIDMRTACSTQDSYAGTGGQGMGAYTGKVCTQPGISCGYTETALAASTCGFDATSMAGCVQTMRPCYQTQQYTCEESGSGTSDDLYQCNCTPNGPPADSTNQSPVCQLIYGP